MYISASIHHTSYIMLNIRSLAYVTYRIWDMDSTIEHYYYSIPYNLYIYYIHYVCKFTYCIVNISCIITAIIPHIDFVLYLYIAAEATDSNVFWYSIYVTVIYVCFSVFQFIYVTRWFKDALGFSRV